MGKMNLIIIMLLLLCGCGDKKVTYNDLENKNDLVYLKNKPYTGIAYSNESSRNFIEYNNGKLVRMVAYYKNGYRVDSFPGGENKCYKGDIEITMDEYLDAHPHLKRYIYAE
ncbi:hypothetical protein D0T51_12235 [Parabacteroides sp. 52]|uniref:hypothetical protein n=1 Tax=unclassified Parabacteroides TaxID=2649774 RepID=UPI0013D798C8|nr:MULTISPECIES: hypothetical protein [unclassified Parabacteroides]MDH6534065.1 uncharacterized lipoprotein YehR (DUF1307 family) [Parabacteroides sp. PM5-20]NDV56487.1 hypothetical protein [Parabacteroides sp. 52]